MEKEDSGVCHMQKLDSRRAQQYRFGGEGEVLSVSHTLINMNNISAECN